MLNLSWACDSPTRPDGRTGQIALAILCDGSGAAPLRCSATTYCAGLYPCPDLAGGGSDVTLSATWSSANASIARPIGPGVFEAVGLGDTVIHASFGVISPAAQTISVFDGTAPLPTNEIFGSIWAAGQTLANGAIDGAVIDVLNGQIAGRTATSGVPPPLPPGFFGPFGGRGYFRILGVPPGAYTLRVVADGFVTQERTVVVPARGSPAADFQMVRSDVADLFLTRRLHQRVSSNAVSSVMALIPTRPECGNSRVPTSQ